MMEELTAQEVEEAFEGIVFPANEDCLTSVRFASTSQSEIQQHSRDRVPAKTKAKENWAVYLFKTWHAQWKVRLDDPESL